MKWKERTLKIVLLCCFFVAVALTPRLSVEADDGNQTTTATSQEQPASDLSGETGFSVEVIPAATQINQEMSFFYVQVKPLEEQVLQVKIISRRVEPSTVEISLNDATTNMYGQIEYGGKIAEYDESMKIPLTQIAKLNTTSMTVENFEEKIVEIKLLPPAEKFSGVRLGALTFLAKDTNEEEAAVTSEYGYKISLMVSEDLTPYNVGGNLNFKKVKARLNSGQKVIATTLQNSEPYVLENVTLETKVTKKNNSEVFASNALTGMKIAPNSSFDFLTYLGLEDLEAGKYTIEITGNDGKQQWHWTEDFNVKQSEANQINQETVYKLIMPNKYKIIIGILGGLSVLNVGYLIYRGGGKFEKKNETSKDSIRGLN